MPNKIQDRLSAADTYTRVVDNIRGYFNYSLSGTWVGTVTLQRSFDGGTTWGDTDNLTENIETFGFEPGKNVQYRAGFKAGNYTSGSCVIRIDYPGYMTNQY